MAINKRGIPKPLPEEKADREEDSAEVRAFIAGAPGKATYAWQNPKVMDDLLKQLNAPQSEMLILKIEHLAALEGKKKREFIETLLREGVEARMKKYGLPD